MNMIDLTVTASDDVESSATVEWNFQGLFPWCTSMLQMLTAFPATINALPFLFLLVILQFSSRALSNRSVAKCYGLLVTLIYWEWRRIRESPHRGQWQSPLQVCDQCQPMGSRFSRVVWRGVGMNANLCSWSFGYGRNAPNKSYFCAAICMVVWYYLWLWDVSEWRNCIRARRKVDLCAPGAPISPKVGMFAR